MKKNEMKNAKIAMKINAIKAKIKLMDKQVRDIEKKRINLLEEYYKLVKDFEMSAIRYIDG